MYRQHLKSCGEEKTLTSRLLNKGFAPKSRRAYLAALMAWAKYTKDTGLTDRLGEIKLPPSNRVTPKIPLELDSWRKLIRALGDGQVKTPGMRQILQVIAMRGMRCGDVLRIRRRDITAAITSGTLSFEAKGSKRIEYDLTVIRAPLEQLLEIKGWDSVRDLVGKPSSSDRVINTRVRRELARVGKRVGVPKVYPHQLRRTYATAFLQALHNDPQALVKLQKHMGWSNINTAASYTDAVSAQDLDVMGAKLMRDLLDGDDKT